MKIIQVDKAAKTQIIEVGEGALGRSLGTLWQRQEKEEPEKKTQDIVAEGYMGESEAITESTGLHKHSGLHQIYATLFQINDYIIQW